MSDDPVTVGKKIKRRKKDRFTASLNMVKEKHGENRRKKFSGTVTLRIAYKDGGVCDARIIEETMIKA
jgi:hypothetical protein